MRKMKDPETIRTLPAVQADRPELFFLLPAPMSRSQQKIPPSSREIKFFSGLL